MRARDPFIHPGWALLVKHPPPSQRSFFKAQEETEGSFIPGPHTWAQIILMNKAVSFLLDSGPNTPKSLPANAGDTRVRVRSLGQEDLEEGTAAHSSILAYKTP